MLVAEKCQTFWTNFGFYYINFYRLKKVARRFSGFFIAICPVKRSGVGKPFVSPHGAALGTDHGVQALVGEHLLLLELLPRVVGAVGGGVEQHPGQGDTRAAVHVANIEI